MRPASLRLWVTLSVLLIARSLHAAPPASPHSQTFEIPPTSANTPFQIAVMPNAEGQFKPADRFDSQVHLAYTPEALRIQIHVVDATPVESNSDETLYNADSVEIFLASKRGDASVYQIQAAPGKPAAATAPASTTAPANPARYFLNDRRSKELKTSTPLTASVSSTFTATGYILTVDLPWKNLAINPQLQTEFAFQIYVNDAEAPNARRHQALFYPRTGAHVDTLKMHTLRLAEKPSPALRLAAKISYERLMRLRIDITADPSLNVPQVSLLKGLFSPSNLLGQALFNRTAGRPTATIRLPIPEAPYIHLSASAGPNTLDLLDIPSFEEAKARALLDLDILATPSVFSGAVFPELDFRNPQLADLLLGGYTLSTRFFDADANEVIAPTKPGRYGALVTAKGSKSSLRRMITLYRTPEMLPWWDLNLYMQFNPPPSVGINPAALAAQHESVSSDLTSLFTFSTYNGDAPAQLLAGLHETPAQPNPAGFYNSPSIKNRDYWVAIRRRVDPLPEKWRTPLALPQAEKTPPALRLGTPEVAAMKPDVPAKLDAHLSQWLADSQTPFNVTVARNGVIFFQKAYGTRNNKPVTNDDTFQLASITKVFSALFLMTAVDQNRITLDEPLTTAFPAWPATNPPHTFRTLFTHTAGFEDHWGEHSPDTLDRFTPLVPFSTPLTKLEYNGTSIVLGTRLLEQITGESLPTFYHRHLFSPLGMQHTDADFATYGAHASSADLAILAQMLLQNGAYDGKRYLSEESIRAMHPLDLQKKLNLPRPAEWGIGLTWRDPEKTLLGHGSATNSTFLFSPSQNLVITMARDNPGKNWGKHHDAFIAILKEGIAK